MNRTRTRRLMLGIAASGALAWGCDKTPPAGPAMAGTAVVSLSTPSENDGGLLVTLRGPGFTAVNATVSDYLVYWRLAGPEDARVLVLGDLQPGPVFSVELKAANRLDEYSASIEQVATRVDTLRSSVSGYQLRFSAPE